MSRYCVRNCYEVIEDPLRGRDPLDMPTRVGLPRETQEVEFGELFEDCAVKGEVEEWDVGAGKRKTTQ